MSRKHRPSRADRRPVTRRYVARVVERARQDIVRAIVANARIDAQLLDGLYPIRDHETAAREPNR